jgi:hypothetical protein
VTIDESRQASGREYLISIDALKLDGWLVGTISDCCAQRLSRGKREACRE